jgi:hypothetical protein
MTVKTEPSWPNTADELREFELALEAYEATRKNVSEIRRLKALGASDHEIALALDIPEELVQMAD